MVEVREAVGSRPSTSISRAGKTVVAASLTYASFKLHYPGWGLAVGLLDLIFEMIGTMERAHLRRFEVEPEPGLIGLGPVSYRGLFSPLNHAS